MDLGEEGEGSGFGGGRGLGDGGVWEGGGRGRVDERNGIDSSFCFESFLKTI